MSCLLSRRSSSVTFTVAALFAALFVAGRAEQPRAAVAGHTGRACVRYEPVPSEPYVRGLVERELVRVHPSYR